MAMRYARPARAKKNPPVIVVSEKHAETNTSEPNSVDPATLIRPEQRHAMIAEAAYYRAEQRGFEPGHELEDWCAAESDIDTLLARDEHATLCGD